MMRLEQRKYTRFRAQDTACAAVGADYTPVGRLIDISIGGLSLEYLTDDNAKLKNPQVDIFVRDKNFHLSKLPCKVIYNMRIDAPGKTQTLTNGLIRKRCGLQFKSLSETHKKQLEAFLRNHVFGVTREPGHSV
ncbi:MAG: PilZ domain-containing protein [Desulfobacterales bacterium]|jgi:c-di-GMP-binding flagellar brake protein YcgR